MSISRRDFLNGVALTIAAGPHAGGADRRAARPLSAGAHRAARSARRLVRDRARAGARARALSARPAADRGALRPGRGRRRHQRACRRLVLPPRRRTVARASSCSTTTTTSAATPSATSSRSMAACVIGYGGSESIDSPRTNYSDVAKGLLRDLGVEVERFETAFERTLYSSLGLSRGVFFAREAFGRDVLVAGEPPSRGADELTRRLANARPLAELVAAFPISDASKAQLLALYDGTRDPLAGKTVEEKLAILKRTSYRDYLTKVCGCSEEVANCFQGRTLGFFGLGCDAVPAAEARDLGYPGFQGLGLPAPAGSQARGALHLSFPRRQRLARAPAGARAHPGCRARPHHGRRGAGGVRLRQARPRRTERPHPARLDLHRRPQRRRRGCCSAMCARGVPHRVEATHAVLACFHMVIPHIMPELPAAQRDGAGAERQDADRLHQRAHAQLAAVGAARRARHLGADVVPQPRQARFSREPRRLPPCARSVRADLPASGACTGRAQPRARCPRPVPHRPGEAAAT